MKHIILSIVLLFSFTGCSLKIVSLALKVKPKEVLTEKQVLVYDKTISLPISPIRHLQFSPTNPDELAIALRYEDGSLGSGNSIHYALIDLKRSRVKKEIKFPKDKDIYSYRFNYSDDGKNLYIHQVFERELQESCQHFINFNSTGKLDKYEKKCEVILSTIFYNKFTILDLNTGKLSPYYEYACEHIPNEDQDDDNKQNRCILGFDIIIQDLDENTLMTDGYRNKEGIVLYDKDSLKAKEIIILENEYQAIILAISSDKKYLLFNEIIRDGEVKSVNYKVYDLKNRKTIRNLGDLTPNATSYRQIFLSNNKIVSKYWARNALSKGKAVYYTSVIDLTTKEKKSVKLNNTFRYWSVLNSRYIIWESRGHQLIEIFDTKEMKIVQQFTTNKYQHPYITVSQKHKKVAFALGNKIYLYNIVEEGE